MNGNKNDRIMAEGRSSLNKKMVSEYLEKNKNPLTLERTVMLSVFGFRPGGNFKI